METEREQRGVWRKLEERHLFPNLSLGGGAYLRGGTYSRTYSKCTKQVLEEGNNHYVSSEPTRSCNRLRTVPTNTEVFLCSL